jgi:hypothetical protein
MSEARDVRSRELQMAVPTGVYGWVHRDIVEPQAQHAAHAVDIGEILHVADTVALMFEQTNQRICHGICKCISQIGRRI